MKYLALFLILCVLVVGVVAGYELLNTRLAVTGQGLQITPATERADEFAALQSAMSRDSLEGTVFKTGELTDAAGYSFQIYTIRLKNNGLLPAEMVEVQLSQLSGDVLYYGESSEVVIAPGATRDVWVSILTTDGTKKARDFYITYYIWGHPQTMKFTYSG